MTDTGSGGKRTSRIRKVRKAIARRIMAFSTMAYEACFVADQKECPYFPADMDCFAVMLKGKSLEQLPKYADVFNDCFLVNNFDKEMELVGDALAGKKCAHFVNRLMTAPLRPENYKRLSITDVQLSRVSAFDDGRLRRRVIRHYKSLGLATHFLPKRLLEFNKRDFGREYARKYPNTGVLAIIYALEMLRPKTLWIFGLDFYQSDYLVRRTHQYPIELQRRDMEQTNLVQVTANIFAQYSDVKVKMVSYYKGFPDVPNVEMVSEPPIPTREETAENE
jgi:hypothetical protein